MKDSLSETGKSKKLDILEEVLSLSQKYYSDAVHQQEIIEAEAVLTSFIENKKNE